MICQGNIYKLMGIEYGGKALTPPQIRSVRRMYRKHSADVFIAEIGGQEYRDIRDILL
jgi:hypothetical protein